MSLKAEYCGEKEPLPPPQEFPWAPTEFGQLVDRDREPLDFSDSLQGRANKRAMAHFTGHLVVVELIGGPWDGQWSIAARPPEPEVTTIEVADVKNACDDCGITGEMEIVQTHCWQETPETNWRKKYPKLYYCGLTNGNA